MSVQVPEVVDLQHIAAERMSDEPIFELTFKRGHVKEDLLFQSKDLPAAIALGNKYCKAARIRFITVTPYVHDLVAMINKLEGETKA